MFSPPRRLTSDFAIYSSMTSTRPMRLLYGNHLVDPLGPQERQRTTSSLKCKQPASSNRLIRPGPRLFAWPKSQMARTGFVLTIGASTPSPAKMPIPFLTFRMPLIVRRGGRNISRPSKCQIGMTPRAQERSAFCTRRGLYHFKRMPFGLSNAPPPSVA